MGNRKEFHPRNWKRARYHKIKQRIRICHRNLKRKRKQNYSNYNVTRLSTIPRKCDGGNSRLRQNQLKLTYFFLLSPFIVFFSTSAGLTFYECSPFLTIEHNFLIQVPISLVFFHVLYPRVLWSPWGSSPMCFHLSLFSRITDTTGLTPPFLATS